MKTYYVAPVMREWKDLGMQLWGIPGSEELARIKPPDGVPGLMLVFESMEKLQEVYPNVDPSKVLTMQVQEKKADGEG